MFIALSTLNYAYHSMTLSELPSQSSLPSKRISDWLDEVENLAPEEPRDPSSSSQRSRRALRRRGFLTSSTPNIMATPDRAGKRRRLEHNAGEEPSTPLNVSQVIEDTDDTPRPSLQQRAVIAEEGLNSGRPALRRRASSGSLASSSSTKSSASTKSNSSSKLGILAELEVADIPLTYIEFASAMGVDAMEIQKLPEDALKIYEDLDAYSTGSGVIPRVLRVRSKG